MPAIAIKLHNGLYRIGLRIVEKARSPRDGGETRSYPTTLLPRMVELALPMAVMLAQVWAINKYGKRGYRARTRKQVVEHRRPSGRAMLPTTTMNELNDSRRRNAPAAFLPVSQQHVAALAISLTHESNQSS